MAESVNIILEEMLPHLEELERVGIFNEVEVKNIVQRRRHYEYRMFRRPAKKDDFSRAIEYEINLNKLRKHRKEKRGISGISQDGEFGISNRIHALYTRALKRFKGDVTLWLEHIDFCKTMNQHELLGRLYGKALAIHPRQTGLWIKAAKFEFEERNSSNSARNLFQQGLRTNSQSQSLWLEYFRMELLHVDRILKRRNILALEEEDAPAISDDILSYKIASIVYREAVRTIPNDVEFRLSFLNILSLFKGVTEREEEIIKNIEGDFPTDPIFLDAISRQPWVNVEHISNAQIQSYDDEIMKRYKLAFVKLQDHREESLMLAEKLLIWHIERAKFWCNEEATSYLAIAVENLIASYEQCYKDELLTEAIATLLIESLYSMGLAEKARVLTKKAVSCYPASELLWVLRLHSEAPSTDIDGLSKLCQSAIDSIGVKNASEILWFEINQNILRGASSSYIESLFQKSLLYDGINAVSSLYLEWSASTGGIRSARKCYKHLLKRRPLSPEVYLKCISLERREHCLKASKVKQLLDAALEDHGETSADLWLEYIAFKISQGHVTEVGNIHWRAMKQLKDDYIDEFTCKYTLLKHHIR